MEASSSVMFWPELPYTGTVLLLLLLLLDDMVALEGLWLSFESKVGLFQVVVLVLWST